jgi:hypothetical protein
MTRTIIVHDIDSAPALSAIQKMALILGPAKACRTADFKADFKEAYSSYVFMAEAAGRGLANIRNLVGTNAEWLKAKPVAFVGFAPESAPLDRELRGIAALLGSDPLVVTVPSGANGPATRQVVDTGMRIRAYRSLTYRTLPREELRKRIEAILNSELYLILCTADGGCVRGTTIGYHYRDGFVYAFCEGSEKYANILLNPNVSLALYTMPEKAGLQISGTASICYPGTPEYEDMCRLLKRDVKRYLNLPFQLNGLVIKLHKAEYYLAKLKDEGFHTKQVFNF